MLNRHFVARTLPRDLRSGAMRIIIFALMIAVGAITAVGLFTDRAERAINEQASSFLGADLVLSSADAFPSVIQTEVRRLNMHSVLTLGFPSVIFNTDHVLLVMVKAVGNGYPLLGQIKVSESPFGVEREAQGPPQRRTIWIGQEALKRLGMKIGESLRLGDAHFRIAGLIRQAPGSGTSLLNFAPRLMMSLADVPITGLVTPQSRVRHELMLTGTNAAIHKFQQWLASRAYEGIRIENVRNSSSAIHNTLIRAQRFLSLAALTAALLGGVAIAVAAASVARREIDQSALMRCLGASSWTVLELIIWRLFIIGLVGSFLGLIAGALAQWGLATLLASWFGKVLPAPGWRPYGVGLGSGLILLLGFALLPVLQVGHVPPLRVLRRELGPPRLSVWGGMAMALLAMCTLLWWQTKDVRLLIWVVSGGLATVLALLVIARILMGVISSWRYPAQPFGWGFGLRNLGRRGALGAIQMAALGLGMSALLLLVFIRSDLLNSWQRSLPADTPNQFAINIQTAQKTGIQQFFSKHGLATPVIYPMVKARLVSINGHRVYAKDYSDSQAQRFVRREFNLSWAHDLQVDNRLVAGKWWSGGITKGFSVDEGLARVLHIHLGDRLTFEMAGQAISARVESLRDIRWDTFRPNFFVLAVPGMLDHFPVSWMTSFYLPPSHGAFLPRLLQDYPNITLFNVNHLIEKVRKIIDQGVRAVEYVFVFTLLSGVMVIYAAIDAAQAGRRRELALLRTLGASRRQAQFAVVVEFAGLGLLTSLIASLSAGLSECWLTVHILKINYQPDPRLWLFGLFSGTLLVTILGVWSTRQPIQKPPVSELLTPG